MQEETVVSAIRREQPISEAPSNVYVITAEDIRQSGATDVPTLLRRVPGMEVMQSTAGVYDVSARGNNQLFANKLLVMVDGRSIYFDYQGGVNWRLLPVTLPEIERIEVLLGPTSALYGFNAFDGVVHILTKDPAEMDNTVLQVGGGEFGTITSAAVYSGTRDQWRYRLSTGLDQAHEWRNRDALAFRAYRGNAQVGYHFTADSKLTLRGGYVATDRYDGPFLRGHRDTSEPSFGYAHVQYTAPRWLIHTWWNRIRDDWDLRSQPPLSDFLSLTDPQGVPRNRGTSHSYDGLAQHTFPLFGTDLTVGANYRHTTVDSNNTNGFQSENRVGLYLQDEWPILSSLRLVSGIRYDLSSGREVTFSPRIALLYRLFEHHTIRLTYSEAYRPPTLSDQHLNVLNTVTIPTMFGPVSTATPVIGSSDVNPEHIRSYELGYQGWFLAHRLRARVNVFYNEISDLISFPGISNPIRARNVGDADVYGGEVGLEAWVTSWLSGFVNGAYQDIDQTITTPDRRRGPEWKVNGGIRLDELPTILHGLSAELAVHYVSAFTQPLHNLFAILAPFGVTAPSERSNAYTLLNVRAGYRFWDDRAEVAFSVFNALNDRHKEHPLGDTIGSRVLGWLTIHL
ncbi:MAG: hypothetical protein NPIRA02_05700 [Nitrospirales bacterium]|nr:MAG: hypothetical protein NPIRA02_05700 [Nitrospirales bacterium]